MVFGAALEIVTREGGRAAEIREGVAEFAAWPLVEASSELA
jgi:hypothetical protein